MRTGFALVELLVVVAIVGLLGSVTFAALAGAKQKAQTVLLANEVQKLQTLLKANMNDFNTYANIQPYQWFTASAACGSAAVSGTYAAQFKDICSNIIGYESGTPADGVGTYFYVGNVGNNNSKYSILVWIPSIGSYYCAGSNLASSYDPGTWFNKGCYNDATL